MKQTIGYVLIDKDGKAFKTGDNVGYGSRKIYRSWASANRVARDLRKSTQGSVRLKVREAFIEIEEKAE